MYPYSIIGDIGLYEILIALGMITAIFTYRITADKLKISARLFNFTLICGLCAIAFGLFSAVFFQALYNISDRGAFIIDKETGATFAGGLIGGTAMFFIIYFIFGKKADKNYISNLYKVVNAAICAIPPAHALGRVGCLMDGCCYGKPTNSFIGIYMQNLGYKVVPTQLFEALFLAALTAAMILLLIKKGRYTMCVYLLGYGAWRFFIEFLRDDDRGTSFIKFLTPSQIIAVMFVIGSAIMFYFEHRYYKKKASEAAE